MGNQTRPAGPPSGYTSGRPSLRPHGNPGRTGAARPSSGGTDSAAHSHSVSEGHQQKACWHSVLSATPTEKCAAGSACVLTFNMRPLAPALKLPAKRHSYCKLKKLQEVVNIQESLGA